jgi:large subunit ribosomal protein L15
MKYNELNLEKKKYGKRVGRGISAGQGKTAGRGTKGQGARTGSSAKPGFAGASNPLMRKLPKLPGFKSKRTPAENVYTGDLEAFGGKTVDAQVLADANLISNAYVTVKVITKGELTKKVTVNLPKASESAIAAIEAAGGTFNKTARLSRATTSTNPKKIEKNATKAK